MYEKEYYTEWQPEGKLLTTKLSGMVNETDIQNWQQTLESAIKQIPADSSFKMLVDIYGFKAENFDAHKKFRVVLPVTLARFGLRIGYLSLFPDAELQLDREDGKQCIVIAHTHHDEGKMELYEQQCSQPNDRYFKDPIAAADWINSVSC